MQQNDNFKTIHNKITKILIYLSSQFHSSYHGIYMSHHRHRCHDHCSWQYCCKKLSNYKGIQLGIEKKTRFDLLGISFDCIIPTITAILLVLELILKNPYKFIVSEEKLKNEHLTSWRDLEAKNIPQQPKKHRRVNLLKKVLRSSYFFVVLMQKIVDSILALSSDDK